MVTKRKRVGITDVAAVLLQYGIEEKDKLVKALESLPVRQKAPPPPPGGISQSEASRRYGVAHSTISRWTSAGYLPVLLRTNKEVYVEEAKLIMVIRCYKSAPGRGKKTVKREFAS
jgi:hypothetical protein